MMTTRMLRPTPAKNPKHRSTLQQIDRAKHCDLIFTANANIYCCNASPLPKIVDRPGTSIDPTTYPTPRRGEAFGRKNHKLSDDENPNASPNPGEKSQTSIDPGTNQSGEALRFDIYRHPNIDGCNASPLPKTVDRRTTR